MHLFNLRYYRGTSFNQDTVCCPGNIDTSCGPCGVSNLSDSGCIKFLPLTIDDVVRMYYIIIYALTDSGFLPLFDSGCIKFLSLSDSGCIGVLAFVWRVAASVFPTSFIVLIAFSLLFTLIALSFTLSILSKSPPELTRIYTSVRGIINFLLTYVSLLECIVKMRYGFSPALECSRLPLPELVNRKLAD